MKVWMYVLIALAVCLVVGALIGVILAINKKKRIKESEKKVEEKIQTSASHLSTLFGGKDNILEITSRGSRVSVTLKDMNIVDKDAIMKELDSCMFMGNRIVFIIGSKSADFEKLLSENIEKQSK